MARPYRFWTYIVTNNHKTIFYTGVTNNLERRLVEHWIGKEGSFTTKYRAFYLLWASETKYGLNAIDLEKRIKRMTRAQKAEIVSADNPNWTFLNESMLQEWPPTQEQIDGVLAYWEEVKRTNPNDPLFILNQLPRSD
jgi:putative endonuclease